VIELRLQAFVGFGLGVLFGLSLGAMASLHFCEDERRALVGVCEKNNRAAGAVRVDCERVFRNYCAPVAHLWL